MPTNRSPIRHPSLDPRRSFKGNPIFCVHEQCSPYYRRFQGSVAMRKTRCQRIVFSSPTSPSHATSTTATDSWNLLRLVSSLCIRERSSKLYSSRILSLCHAFQVIFGSGVRVTHLRRSPTARVSDQRSPLLLFPFPSIHDFLSTLTATSRLIAPPHIPDDISNPMSENKKQRPSFVLPRLVVYSSTENS